MNDNKRSARYDEQYRPADNHVRRVSSASRTGSSPARRPSEAARPQAGRTSAARSSMPRSTGREYDPRRTPSARSSASRGTSEAQRRSTVSHTGTRRPVNPAPQPRQPVRRVSARKALLRRRRRALTAFVFLAILLGIGGYVLHVLNVVGVFHPTYVKNIYVNGYTFAGATKEDGIAAAKTIEDEWLDESYTFAYLDQSWTFTRRSVDADIDYENQLEYAWNLGHIGSIFERKRVIDVLAKSPVYLESKISYSEEKLDAFVDGICAAIDVAPVDAVVVPDATAPVVISESKTGLQVNREQLREQLVLLIEKGIDDTVIPVETLFPTVTSDQLSFQIIADVKTDTSFRNSNSRANVHLALNAFNGMVVQPGEECDFNEIVGPRTKERGFKRATEYAGDTVVEDYGGGVCQASTTLYQALIHSGMTILERRQHTMTVVYSEPSRDAAVSYGNKNLIFKNNTEYPIYIYTSVTKEWATVTIYGHRPDYRYEIESVLIEQGIPSTKYRTIEDATGEHVYYKDDPPVLAEKGKDGCTSEGWLVAYDWETGEEVSRTQVDRDYYKPGVSTYWVGVHDRTTEFIDPSTLPAY